MAGIKERKVIIATHVYATGPAQEFRDFLVGQRVAKLLFIGHPLFFDARLRGSGRERYEHGDKVEEKFQRIRRMPALYSYVRAFFLNIGWGMRSGDGWDLFVGCNNLNALSGLVLRAMGMVEKVVYYVVDYNPRRFSNPILNFLYHRIDQFCVRHCDETWNLSDAMRTARLRYFRFEGGRQIEVPMGVWFDRIRRKAGSGVHRFTLVFMGHVIKKQGIQNVIAAMPKILAKIPGFRFKVIGGGNFLDDLKNQSRLLGVEASVEFTGYIDDHAVVEELMSGCGLAISMYEKFDDAGDLSFTNFTDPGKLKNYLASGLFVLTTDVPPRAVDLEKTGCGKIVKNDPDSIAEAVTTFMFSQDMERLRANAVEYARRYDWNVIFGQRTAALWPA